MPTRDNLAHRVQSIYRVQSSVWRLPNSWPPTPSPPSECVLPPHQRRGVHTRRAVREWGVIILEDARHWIDLLQYKSLYGLAGQAVGPGQVLGEQPGLLRREGGGRQQGGDPQHVRGQGQGGHQAQARHFQVNLIFVLFVLLFPKTFIFSGKGDGWYGARSIIWESTVYC